MRIKPLALALCLAVSGSALCAPLTYQGELMDAGRPADGRYDLQLTVHSDPVQRSALAFPVTIENVEVRDGRFRVDADFGPLLRGGVPVSPESAWLEVAVRDAGAAGAFDSLDKREKIALDKAIAACWSSTGDDGSNPAINFLGTLDAQPLELRVNNQRAARFEPNTISPNLLQGHATNLVASGVRGAVVSGGGAASVSDPDVNGESFNRVDGHYAVVGGGAANQAGDIGLPAASAFATVGGGRGNQATGEASTVSGGAQNDARARAATVSGGSSNDARAPGATVGGGFTNVTHATSSVIAGGDQNRIELAAPGATGASGAVIGGGDSNTITATGQNATIGGGAENIASGSQSTISGGGGNVINDAGDFAAIGGGIFNAANGAFSVVSGGTENTAAGFAAVVPGGRLNCAGGESSFAAGSRALVRGPVCDSTGVQHDGTFVWSDVSSTQEFASSADNQFRVRANGGVEFVTANTPFTGARLAPGSGSWASFSDRHAKSNVLTVDSRAILDALLGLSISTWNYIAQDEGIRHIGPMAQDFKATFGLGDDERLITSIDADGVALAAIQGLNAKLEAENAAQRDLIARLEARLQAVEARQAASAGTTAEGR